MSYLKDYYKVYYNDTEVGYYYVMSDGSSSYSTAWGSPWDLEKELKEYKIEELKYKPHKKKDKVKLSEEEMKALAELEKNEEKSKLDDN